MRLTELDPAWIGAGGAGVTDKNGDPAPERHGVGVTFDCPCGCGSTVYVPFTNPLDGGPAYERRVTWRRTGETFDTLTLTPSIRRVPYNGSCGWHGFVRDGGIETCADSVPAAPAYLERMKKFNERVSSAAAPAVD